MCRGLAVAGASLGAMFWVWPLAVSADVGDHEAHYQPEKASRRSEFTAGLQVGPLLGQAAGFPNEAAKIGVASERVSTEPAFGYTNLLWLGGALRDWFTFGLAFGGTRLAGNDVTAEGFTLGVHLEAFPLYYQGGAWRDLALITTLGAGGMSLTRESDGKTAAEGGSLSIVAIGTAWEALRLGRHFNLGPTAEFSHQFSETLTVSAVSVGARFTYYSGP